MRSVLSEISSKLFGLSVLVFILALLIPLLGGSPSPSGKAGTAVPVLSGAIKKTVQGLELEHAQSPAIEKELQPSITPLQGEVKQNQSKELTESAQTAAALGQVPQDASSTNAMDQNQGASSAVQSLQTPPEPTIPQINEKSSRPVNPIATEEKRSSRQEPTSLLVLGGDFFPPGQVTPSANTQAAIDKIIQLINMRSSDNVVIEGHADNWMRVGVSPAQATEWNNMVSLRRASAVAKLLEQKGVASDRIIVHGFGAAVPIASNLTKEGRTQNRRVEIKLLPAQ